VRPGAKAFDVSGDDVERACVILANQDSGSGGRHMVS